MITHLHTDLQMRWTEQIMSTVQGATVEQRLHQERALAEIETDKAVKLAKIASEERIALSEERIALAKIAAETDKAKILSDQQARLAKIEKEGEHEKPCACKRARMRSHVTEVNVLLVL